MPRTRDASASEIRIEIRAQLGGKTKKTADQLFNDVSRALKGKRLRTTKLKMLNHLSDLIDEGIIAMDGTKYMRTQVQ